ncbi:MAG: membrane protein insertase YidC [Phycisphaerales bacterium]|jgi:YidC/Oxa1 family membrane protein insertase
MAAPTKSIARILIPLSILVALGLLIALPVINQSGSGTGTTGQQQGQQEQPATPDTTPATDGASEEAADDEPVQADAGETAQPADEPTESPSPEPETQAPPPADMPAYRVLPALDPNAAMQPARIGGVDPEAFALELSFSPLGAGVERIELAGFSRKLGSADPVPVQETWNLPTVTGGTVRIVPFAAVAVEIDGQRVPIYTALDDAGVVQPAWNEVGPGRFDATIVDAQGTPVLTLERHYQADGTSHDFTLRHSARNLTDQPLDVRWITFGPAQLYQESQGYGGDKRRVRFGFVEPGNPNFVVGGDYMETIAAVSGKRDKQTGRYEASRRLWPTTQAENNGNRLAWAGLTNRYFGVAMHGVAEGDASAGSIPLLTPVESVSRVLLDTAARPNEPNYVLGLEVTSPAYEVPAGEASAHQIGIYAGPLSRSLITSNPSANAVMLRQLVQYTFGGPCGFCTFPWLAHILVWLLNLIHDYVTLDWALAIIILVLIVRTVLHPVTKWSQIRVQRFSHQMQQMAPKQKKIQEKYKSDPKRMQAEMAKLWREEGINPAGMLGCLPMFLQTPVWIALYASLYFAIELRHEAAFFGVFQMIGGWPFLADLAQPDSAIPLPQAVHFSLPLMGTITAINVLPLLLGVVFFVQQKYMMPPPSATMTPEQLAQQRMMKVMMVVMFPIFMYNAPSGLAVYFIANSALGIIEMRYIRAHINKNDLLTPKQRDPGKKTYMQRLMERAQQRQEMMQAARGQGPAKGPTSGALGARRKKTENRRKGRRP